MNIATTIKNYHRLTKPGIIRGNVIVATAGFLFASAGNIDWVRLLFTIEGTTLLIASACVFNNYIDRHIDKKMARTKNRALVTGVVGSRNALIFATILGLSSVWVLAKYVNLLVVAIGLIGFIDYVVLYGIFKRKSVHSTLIGSIAGATPPVAGYCAVTGHFDAAALLLFLVLVVWQMPHFYAIGTYRLDEYKKASLPILTIKKGVNSAKQQIILYIVGFIAVCSLLTLFGYTGQTFLLVMVASGAYWLYIALVGRKTSNDELWARRVFRTSLSVLMIFSVLISINHWLP